MKATPYTNKRLNALRGAMSRLGIDAVILQKPENIYYFSRFNPVINSHPCFVIVTGDTDCLLVHSLRASHAGEEAATDTIQLYGKWGNTHPVAMKPVDAIAAILGKKKLRLGIETDYISLKQYQELNRKLDVSDVADVSREISLMKLIKDDIEIACIRKSAQLVDIGVETAICCLEEGYSEAQAATEGQYAMRKMWSECFPNSEVSGFGTSEGGMIDSLHVWCLSNEHIAYGCDCPRHYHPAAGDLSLPMAWAKTDGYHAENERSVLIGQTSALREKAYGAMLEARQAIFDVMKPGVTFATLYEKAAGVYTAHGFGDILPGRVGHGVGCSAHEFPSLEKGNMIPLAPGMVMTVEPGLMDKEWGGVRHSDTVLITEDGYECLTKLRRDTIRIDPPARAQ